MKRINSIASHMRQYVPVPDRLTTWGRRAAARLEGVVRNRGIKPKRKEPKTPTAS